jgi:hypothetical protein
VSQDATDWVWDNSRAKGVARLVVLAIAFMADAESCTAAASISTLQQYTSAGRPTVVGAVASLIVTGEIEIVTGVTGPFGAAVYRLPKAVGYARMPEIKALHRKALERPGASKFAVGLPMRRSRSGSREIDLQGGTALYRAFGPRGELLYVGVSGQPLARWRLHATTSEWWPVARRLTYEVFPGEIEALDHERHAIKSEKPQYNRRSATGGCTVDCSLCDTAKGAKG